MRFTREEFYIMVDQLLNQDPISFNMLCEIAEKTLRPSVIKWCNDDEYLNGRGYEDDIMQEIHLRLIQKTISYFLLRDGITGAYNDDPEGFEDWIFRVADNHKRDFAKKVRKRDFKIRDLDDPTVIALPVDDHDDSAERIDELKEAFSIVISSDVGIYKVLTWLAQFVLILNFDVTKIKSNEMIISEFKNKSLYEMYDMILAASKKIPWLAVTSAQNEKIMAALRKKRKNGVLYGETKYEDFFMKHNGEVSGKKSISDWMNRMNDMIKKKVADESASPKNTDEKTSVKEEQE